MKHIEHWQAYLTNGEISCKIHFSKYSCGINPPDGVIFGQDNAGNYYLNGKKAWITYRKDGEMA